MSGVRIRILIASTLALSIVAAGAIGLSSIRSGSSESTMGDLLALCARNGSVDIGCINQGLDAVNLDKPALAAAYVVSDAESSSKLGESCHGIMHLIGQKIYNRVDEVAVSLSSHWAPCGYGLLHGVMERQIIPTNLDEAAAKVKSLCMLGNLQDESRVYGECLHSLGHAIFDSRDNFSQALEVCDTAFATESGVPDRIGCYTGLAMKQRDKVLVEINNGRVIEPNVEAFEEVGQACAVGDSLFALACAPGFIQIATDSSPEHVKPFLSWCSATAPEASNECFRQAGVYMGHFRDKFDSLSSSIAICDSGTATEVESCRIGMVEGLENRGESRARALDELCQSYKASLGREGVGLCAKAREIYPLG